MHSPTTSPYGDSSFQKEENRVTTDLLVITLLCTKLFFKHYLICFI